MNTETQFTADALIPPAYWDRDHFSTLAYIETKLVDGGKYLLQFDPSMRQKRRHFRELLGRCVVSEAGGLHVRQSSI